MNSNERYAARLEYDTIKRCKEDHANEIKALQELTERLKEALEKCLLPENIECDGPGCTGCYKDVIHAALTAYKEAKTNGT